MVLLLLWADVARGSFITQSLDFRLLDLAPATSLRFEPPNPSDGVPSSVFVRLDLTQTAQVGVWRTGGAADAVNFSARLSGSTLAVEGKVQALDTIDLRLTPTLPLVTFPTANSEAAAFRNAFDRGETPAAPSGGAGSGRSLHTFFVALPADFDGRLELEYDAGFWNPQGTNTFTTWKADVIGRVTLVYDYTAIPEPATTVIALGLVALGGASVCRRRAVRRPGPTA